MAKNKKKKRSVKLGKNAKEVKVVAVLIATLLLAPMVIFALSIRYVDIYTFVNVDLFPLWYVALAIGAVAGVLFCMKFATKEHGIWKRIGLFAIISFIFFVGLGSVFAHLNHWFDTSKPVRYEVVIEDKDRRNRRKSRDRYEFTVTVNGDTFDVNVSWRDYKHYNEGDVYVIEYREGAFGEPYYIGVGWLNN